MFGVLFVLGMFLDVMSMMLLTLPIFLPLAQTAGLDPILFGIVMLIGLEVSFITPPLGMLLFVMMGVVPGASLAEVSRAAFPYVVCTAALVALMIYIPQIVTWPPRLIG